MLFRSCALKDSPNPGFGCFPVDAHVVMGSIGKGHPDVAAILLAMFLFAIMIFSTVSPRPNSSTARLALLTIGIFQKVFESDFSDWRINLPRNDHRTMRLLFHDFANVRLFVLLAFLQKWIGN